MIWVVVLLLKGVFNVIIRACIARSIFELYSSIFEKVKIVNIIFFRKGKKSIYIYFNFYSRNEFKNILFNYIELYM